MTYGGLSAAAVCLRLVFLFLLPGEGPHQYRLLRPRGSFSRRRPPGREHDRLEPSDWVAAIGSRDRRPTPRLRRRLGLTALSVAARRPCGRVPRTDRSGPRRSVAFATEGHSGEASRTSHLERLGPGSRDREPFPHGRRPIERTRSIPAGSFVVATTATRRQPVLVHSHELRRPYPSLFPGRRPARGRPRAASGPARSVGFSPLDRTRPPISGVLREPVVVRATPWFCAGTMPGAGRGRPTAGPTSTTERAHPCCASGRYAQIFPAKARGYEPVRWLARSASSSSALRRAGRSSSCDSPAMVPDLDGEALPGCPGPRPKPADFGRFSGGMHSAATRGLSVAISRSRPRRPPRGQARGSSGCPPPHPGYPVRGVISRRRVRLRRRRRSPARPIRTREDVASR